MSNPPSPNGFPSVMAALLSLVVVSVGGAGVSLMMTCPCPVPGRPMRLVTSVSCAAPRRLPVGGCGSVVPDLLDDPRPELALEELGPAETVVVGVRVVGVRVGRRTPTAPWDRPRLPPGSVGWPPARWRWRWGRSAAGQGRPAAGPAGCPRCRAGCRPRPASRGRRSGREWRTGPDREPAAAPAPPGGRPAARRRGRHPAARTGRRSPRSARTGRSRRSRPAGGSRRSRRS